jgi:hypothetical protein
LRLATPTSPSKPEANNHATAGAGAGAGTGTGIEETGSVSVLDSTKLSISADDEFKVLLLSVKRRAANPVDASDAVPVASPIATLNVLH